MPRRAPQYERLNEMLAANDGAFMRGDFVVGIDEASARDLDEFKARRDAYKAAYAAALIADRKMYVYDPEKLTDGDIITEVAKAAGIPLERLTKERLKRAIDLVEENMLREQRTQKPKPPCECRACVQARAERARREENELKAAITAEAMRILGAPRCGCTRDMLCKACADKQWTPNPPAPVSVRVNKCDCPGCNPVQHPRIEPRAEQAAIGQAMRVSGWRTPDNKRLGAGRYTGDGCV